MSIPTIDLEDLTSADTTRRDRAAHDVREGFGHYGLVYVRGHGIRPADLDAYYDSFLALTAAPEADKRALARPDIWYQRGWTPPNTEQAVAAQGQPDFKECYFAAPEALDPTCKVQYPQIFADNFWPSWVPAMEGVYMALGHSLHEAGAALLHGCELALGLEHGLFANAIKGGAHVTRALRYLPLTDEHIASQVLWGEEHTDFNLLTLLPGGRFLDPQGNRCPPPDAESGLYLRTRATPEAPRGTMVRGRPPEGCIVAQVGQQLEILTGGTLLATPHVVTAPKVAGYSRLSCAHFVHLHPNEVVFPLKGFRSDENVRAYSPPVLAGTYSLKTLVDIHLAPASALDLLGYRHYDRMMAQREGL